MTFMLTGIFVHYEIMIRYEFARIGVLGSQLQYFERATFVDGASEYKCGQWGQI
jgi:hypothetical protein